MFRFTTKRDIISFTVLHLRIRSTQRIRTRIRLYTFQTRQERARRFSPDYYRRRCVASRRSSTLFYRTLSRGRSRTHLPRRRSFSTQDCGRMTSARERLWCVSLVINRKIKECLSSVGNVQRLHEERSCRRHFLH